MTIETRLIEYQHGSLTLEGFMAWDARLPGPLPAVAISHTWAGRSEFEQDAALQLARGGYVGFAVDMYGKGVRGGSPEENAALMTPLLFFQSLFEFFNQFVQATE